MGKAHYMVKVLTEVLNSQRKLTPDIARWEQRKQISLWGIAKTAKAKPKHRFRDVYRMLTPYLLWQAWHRLNKKISDSR
jgi:hypothetical protein